MIKTMSEGGLIIILIQLLQSNWVSCQPLISLQNKPKFLRISGDQRRALVYRAGPANPPVLQATINMDRGGLKTLLVN